MRLRPYLEVLGILGEGTFGRVLECYDWHRRCKVAVKVVRAGKKYTEAALIEAETLELIAKADPGKDSGCVQCFEWFMYKDKYAICLWSLNVQSHHREQMVFNCHRTTRDEFV